MEGMCKHNVLLGPGPVLRHVVNHYWHITIFRVISQLHFVFVPAICHTCLADVALITFWLTFHFEATQPGKKVEFMTLVCELVSVVAHLSLTDY